MVLAPPPAPAIEEAPLISNGFVYRLTAVVALLAVLTVAISIGGRWLGQRISLGGHTDDTKVFTVTVGEDTLRLAANTIRFPSERSDGSTERVDLYLTWPQMQGYNEADRLSFNDVSQSSSLIFLQFTQSTMSRDMSGRLAPIYSHLIEGDPFAGPHGLTAHRLRADAGYTNEVLLTAPRPGKPDYVVRCVLPSTPDKATSGDCQRDVHLGKDLTVLYRFSSALLGDWDHIDAAIQTFVESRLAEQPAASTGAPATDG
ncbi:hypothetical protein [Rhizobium sp. BK376]|jgi:hypothetical protein|uniref:hypothetical protein n=1 Tax=Rhizobium sp. BK376 TaxID=2512149 RepID=UPI001044E219|nr:hypothetical protein [Rhizobium sp. BK376]TCR82198.1 hypothetical protein EV561_111102 [Rhizobium sp. BK376]